MNNGDEIISAFAFNTGREIEQLINTRLGDLEFRLKRCEALVLQWFLQTGDKDFAEHFGIVSQKEGKIV